MEGWLWEVSASLIVKVLQKSEPGVMVEEVSYVRSLDAGCPSPSSLSLGSRTKSCDVIGCAYVRGYEWVWPCFPNPVLRCKVQDLLSCVQALGSGITFFFLFLVIFEVWGITPPG